MPTSKITPLTLSNNLVQATIDNGQLTTFTDGTPAGKLSFENDDFAVTLVPKWSGVPLELNSTYCHLASTASSSSSVITVVRSCPGAPFPNGKPPGSINPELPVDYSVAIEYELREGASFVSKQLRVESSRPFSDVDGAYMVQSVSVWHGITVTGDGPVEFSAHPNMSPQVASRACLIVPLVPPSSPHAWSVATG